jgi:hypothetical protein
MITHLLLVFALFRVDECGGGVAGDRGKAGELWPEALIPFKIDESVFDRDVIHHIREAMNNWEKNTCIRFVPYIDQSDYILISSSGTG